MKRLQRKVRGEADAGAILEDLHGRAEPEAVAAQSVMTKLLGNPDFDEPWD